MEAGKLISITSNDNIHLYNVSSSQTLEAFIISMSETQYLFCNPECCGLTFQEKLSDAIQYGINVLLQTEDTNIGSIARSSPIDVLVILRGGLNFNLHQTLTRATGTLPEVSFISSQRRPVEQGFVISEASYEKWSMQDGSLFCVGDISATGTTLKNAIERAVGCLQSEHKIPQWILIITIGTSWTLNNMSDINNKLLHLWSPNFRGTTILFLESIFHLYENDPMLSGTHIPFTDFFRKNAICAPEFERISFANPVCFLERCAIYDGGSRAFEPTVYMRNLCQYWEKLAQQSNELDVTKILNLKSDMLDYKLSLTNWLEKRPLWEGIDREELTDLYCKGKIALDALLSKRLEDICGERLAALRNLRIKSY